MALRKVLALSVLIVYGGILIINLVESCNEVVCASIVSKCMLTQSCKCEPKNCSCYKECLSCLGKKYYEECCSCVELCPKPNETRNALSKKSHVEEFDGVPELFNALITSESEEYEWDIVTFPVDFDTVLAGPKLEKDVKYYLKSNEHDSGETLKERDHLITVNCSVLYLAPCISWNKCRQSCHSTGANSYRWFHDGCCECVGATCINYGINDSRCRRCPESKDDGDDLEEIVDDELQDFGDEMGPFDGTVNTHF